MPPAAHALMGADRARPGIRYLAGDWQLVCESLVSQGCGYDIILTSETTYSSTASSRLLKVPGLSLLGPRRTS